ncbi:hypothetical protein Gotri_019113 [Gossypium trilobum]|uniref:Uncharacterized protein n=1 Tax=Gossypium trilobum TaxID=34281 RepID=A0A7J9EBQ9_9ROSI|nr:hypothetical protein [Gossypium trilobum]
MTKAKYFLQQKDYKFRTDGRRILAYHSGIIEENDEESIRLLKNQLPGQLFPPSTILFHLTLSLFVSNFLSGVLVDDWLRLLALLEAFGFQQQMLVAGLAGLGFSALGLRSGKRPFVWFSLWFTVAGLVPLS